MKISVTDFGQLSTGEIAKKFTLQNDNNVKLVLTDYGATTVSLVCPDRNGEFDDVLLGFDNIEGYLENNYFGSTIGRFANRIAKGQFTLNDKLHQLNCNNGENHLHGGTVGWNKKLWKWTEENNGILFELNSEEGEENYPGTVHASVFYSLNNENEIKMTFKAKTLDKPTLINLTNHAFWNLSGQKANTKILDHFMEIDGPKYLPVTDALIPTGEMRDVVSDDPFNFLSPKSIGKDIELAGGYDHNYCLRKENGQSFCARVYHEASGRQLEVYSSQPGIQFYSGNFLKGQIGKNNNIYEKHFGFALEPQHYPDNINHPTFPSSIVKPGDTYEHFISWRLTSKS